MSRFKKEKEQDTTVVSRDERGRPDTVGKTETFFTRHVRLITFLICLAVFLVFFGPISVFTIRSWIEEKNDTRIPMTEEDLLALSQLDRKLYFSDISRFRGEKDINMQKYKVDLANGTEIREEPVELYYYINIGDRYTALAIADFETEEIIYFRVNDRKRHIHADLLTDDIYLFLQGIPVSTTAAKTKESTTAAVTD